MKAALQLHRSRITDEMLEDTIFPVLRRLGMDYEVLPRFSEEDTTISDDTDMLLVLGGDGTFLTAARLATLYQLPVLGVMVGRLGFLSSVDLPGMESALQNILDGDMPIEERCVLRGKVYAGAELQYEGIAVNDIVVLRHEDDKIREFRARHNGKLL